MFLEINPASSRGSQAFPGRHRFTRDAVTLDELVPDKRYLRPALVKIDVQGAEMLVLKGAASILKNAAPALFIELHEEGLSKFGTSVSAILNHLSNAGTRLIG